ncbi:MAG: hypothetical protein MZU97_13245 [Bacillus subtilis]|nr:hypothetical protein [Bacillus subtilis]
MNRSPVDYGDARDAELVILTDITANKKNQETISFADYLGRPHRPAEPFEAGSGPAQDVRTQFGDAYELVRRHPQHRQLQADQQHVQLLVRRRAAQDDQHPSEQDPGGPRQDLPVRRRRVRLPCEESLREQVYEVAHKVMRVFESPFYIEGYETSLHRLARHRLLERREQGSGQPDPQGRTRPRRRQGLGQEQVRALRRQPPEVRGGHRRPRTRPKGRRRRRLRRVQGLFPADHRCEDRQDRGRRKRSSAGSPTSTGSSAR